MGLPALGEPVPEVLRGLRSKEPHSVLLPLASMNVDGAGGEAYVLVPQPQSLANAEARIRQQRNEGTVAPALEGVWAVSWGPSSPARA